MERFVDSINLLPEICSIVKNAKQEILIVCPFIELHHYFRRSLRVHINNPDLSITILYGKYSIKDHYKLPEDDLEFLKSFPNIQVLYHERLHAKYYANEATSLVTSLNLNHNSANKNIEYGIVLKNEPNSIVSDIKQFIDELICESEIIYQNILESKDQIPINISSERIDKIKLEYPNAWERWSEEDDERLELLFCEGKSIKELSTIFQRKVSAITSRINKLELHEKYGI